MNVVVAYPERSNALTTGLRGTGELLGGAATINFGSVAVGLKWVQCMAPMDHDKS